MVLCTKRVVSDILAAKCSTWVLVEEFWTKLTSYDVIHNITVFDLKVQDWERNGFNKACGIIELKMTDKYKKNIDLKMVFVYIEKSYSQVYCKIYKNKCFMGVDGRCCFYSLIGGHFLQNHG